MPSVGQSTVADVLGGGDPGRAAASLARGLERADVAEEAPKFLRTTGAAAYVPRAGRRRAGLAVGPRAGAG